MLQTLKTSAIAAAGALIALAAAQPASADQSRAHLGPVGPNQPILATIGHNRMIAYYEPDGGKCAVSAVVFDTSPSGGGHASTRVRVALGPGEILNLDGVENQRVVLACGPNAGLLTVLNRGELLTRAARVN